jgi:hypothetical protein
MSRNGRVSDLPSETPKVSIRNLVAAVSHRTEGRALRVVVVVRRDHRGGDVAHGLRLALERGRGAPEEGVRRLRQHLDAVVGVHLARLRKAR